MRGSLIVFAILAFLCIVASGKSKKQATTTASTPAWRNKNVIREVSFAHNNLYFQIDIDLVPLATKPTSTYLHAVNSTYEDKLIAVIALDGDEELPVKKAED